MATADLPQLDTLTPEAKRELLAILVRDLATDQSGSIAVSAGGEDYVLYRVPRNARENARRFTEQCSPEYLAELERRAANPGKLYTVDEILRVTPEDAARLSQK